MPRETPSLTSPETEMPYDVKTLSAQSKMRYILEIFDSGKGTEEDKEKRKANFIELLKKYHSRVGIAKAKQQLDSLPEYKSKKNRLKEYETSDQERASIHNQIMEIINNMSNSRGLTPGQLKVVEYLSQDRKAVAEIIEGYFMTNNPSDPNEYSELKQAIRGDGYFTGRREED